MFWTRKTQFFQTPCLSTSGTVPFCYQSSVRLSHVQTSNSNTWVIALPQLRQLYFQLVTYLEPDGMRMTSSLESFFVSPFTVTLASPSWQKESICQLHTLFGWIDISMYICEVDTRCQPKNKNPGDHRFYFLDPTKVVELCQFHP